MKSVDVGDSILGLNCFGSAASSDVSHLHVKFLVRNVKLIGD